MAGTRNTLSPISPQDDREPSDEELARDLARVFLRVIRKIRKSVQKQSSPGAEKISSGMPLAPKILFSRKEASQLLSISLRSLDELIARGELRAIHKGRRKTLLHHLELERWAKTDSPGLGG